mmetsp:Transcript_1791/g.1971  ORF Transcript_1791/g.1971 Transcript_1791/m.1971 type:complete len:501 (+) Transcript_1791:179-1681(+)
MCARTFTVTNNQIHSQRRHAKQQYNNYTHNTSEKRLNLFKPSTRPFKRLNSRAIRKKFLSQGEAYQQHILEDIGVLLGVKDISDWYNVQQEEVKNLEKKFPLLRKRLLDILFSTYDNYEWRPWRFDHEFLSLNKDSSKKSFSLFTNILSRINMKHNLNTQTKWYEFISKDIYTHVGFHKVNSYAEPIVRMLQLLTPYTWDVWTFKFMWRNYWNSRSVQAEKLDHIASQLNIKHLDEWFGITFRDIERLGGRSVMQKHGNSLHSALRALYPYKWRLKHARKFPQGHWKKKENQEEFLNNVSHQYNIKSHNEWYRLSERQLTKQFGPGVLRYYRDILETLDPSFSWDWRRLSAKNKRSTQRWLYHCVCQIFPDDVVLEEHYIGIPASAGHWHVVDIFIPTKNLVVEYQGEQHYNDNVIFQSMPASALQARDISKAELCTSLGLTLVPIPYWWRGDIDSIRATIASYVPSMVKVSGDHKPLSWLNTSSTFHLPLMAPRESTPL